MPASCSCLTSGEDRSYRGDVSPPGPPALRARTIALTRALTITLLAIAVSAPISRAQEVGCCQFTVRSDSGSERRCRDLVRAQCTTLLSVSTFLPDMRCNGLTQRCVRSLPPPTSTPIATRTRTFTPTPTPMPPQLARGCCQINDRHRPWESTCGNDVTEATCEQSGHDTEFCRDCDCSSHSEAGFTGALGICVQRTPTPTRTPTPAARPDGRRGGCCQIDNLRRVGHPVCGNAIDEASCLQDYAGNATFCPDCVCTSHDGAGFDLTAGACVTRTPTPTPTRMPTPRIGCCQLDRFRGSAFTVCGNLLTEDACRGDSRGVPRFVFGGTCSSHTTPGFGTARGVCVQTRRPGRPRPIRLPRPPRPARSF
jgi:hypothetical protein